MLFNLGFLFISAMAQTLAIHQDTDNKAIIEVSPDQVYEFHIKEAFTTIHEKLGEIDTSSVRNHFLGKEVAVRMHLLDNTYIIRSAPAPGSFSEKVKYRKPVIYNSVFKIERYYRSQVRHKSISVDIAKENMIRIIELSIALVYEDTGKFEKELARAEGVNEILEVYGKIKPI